MSATVEWAYNRQRLKASHVNVLDCFYQRWDLQKHQARTYLAWAQIGECNGVRIVRTYASHSFFTFFSLCVLLGIFCVLVFHTCEVKSQWGWQSFQQLCDCAVHWPAVAAYTSCSKQQQGVVDLMCFNSEKRKARVNISYQRWKVTQSIEAVLSHDIELEA